MAATTAAGKTVLAAGLGRFGPPHLQASIKEKVEADLVRVKAAGIDTTVIYLNPEDIPGTLAMLREELQKKQYDGFLIGWGVRGNKDLTVLFEGAVNESRKTSPNTTLIFGTAPDGTFDAIVRAFPDEQ